MLSATASYKVITADLSRSLKNTAQRPDVARQTEYFLKNVSNIKSIDDFFGDTRIYQYAMKAFGLEDMTYAKAFMRKVLDEGIDSSTSFANSLSDRRYREFAEAFNFKRYGDATTAFDRAQQGTVDKYVRLTLEQNAGLEDEGVRLALYFERKAPAITSTLQLLADPALLKVTQVALGFSEATGALPIDKQVALISKRLDVEDLQDPKKLEKFITRFTSLWEAQKEPVGFSNALLIGNPTAGIGGDLLASIQNLRFGGL